MRLGRKWRTALLAVLLVTVSGTGVYAATDLVAGPHHDGTAVIPTGYQVTPAGQQSNLGDLPLNAVASPDGRWLAVSNDGQGTQSLQLVDAHTGKVAQKIEYKKPEALFAGLVFSPDGRTLYASAGGNNKIRTYSVSDGHLAEGAPIMLPTTSTSGKKLNPFPAGLAITPDGKRLVVADRLADAVTVVDLSNGTQQTTGIGHAPFGVILSPDGRRAWVTEQGANTVRALDIGGAQPVATGAITVGTHPNAVTRDRSGAHLYVANGDSDEISVIDAGNGSVVKTFSLAPYQGAKVGSNPDGLTLSADQRTLYVANAGNNDIAAVDVASGKIRGLIPTAWYPTSVVATPDRLLVTNAKGLGAGPNNGPGHPNPEDPGPTNPSQYSGSMMVGTLSMIDGINDQAKLDQWTQQVRRNDGFDTAGQAPEVQSSVVPRHPGEPTPIKHVIYVVKENRTYDQEFGSIGQGNGDPSLNLFGEESAPNARAMQRKFSTVDNFYADAEVSAQGWNWTVAANSNPYSEQGWPANYSGRNHPYPSETGDPETAPNADPANAYIWDRLAKAKIPFRNYGFYVADQNGKSVAKDPVLNANTDPAFRGFDLNCPDSAGTFTAPPSCGTPRINEWKREFDGYDKGGNLPAMEFVRLPNDHTAATKAGAPTPKAYVGDNDLALGQLVDAVSHSQYWKDTAIFVTEDDAQNGPDHVDAHRTISQVISPYSRTGAVDSTFYSTASMLRTMELLVGLPPLTQFDAYAAPMSRSFTTKPDFTPYTAVRPSYQLDQRNGANAPMAAQAAAQDLGSEDKIDEQVFNQAIWQSVHGPGSPMPAPRHMLAAPAATPPEGDGDD